MAYLSNVLLKSKSIRSVWLPEDKFINKLDELSFTEPPFPKLMLEIIQDVVFVEMLCEV